MRHHSYLPHGAVAWAFRAFVVGMTYQLGNLISSASSTIESTLGKRFLLLSRDGESMYQDRKVVYIFMDCAYAYVIVLTLVGLEYLSAPQLRTPMIPPGRILTRQRSWRLSKRGPMTSAWRLAQPWEASSSPRAGARSDPVEGGIPSTEFMSSCLYGKHFQPARAQSLSAPCRHFVLAGSYTQSHKLHRD